MWQRRFVIRRGASLIWMAVILLVVTVVAEYVRVAHQTSLRTITMIEESEPLEGKRGYPNEFDKHFAALQGFLLDMPNILTITGCRNFSVRMRSLRSACTQS